MNSYAATYSHLLLVDSTFDSTSNYDRVQIAFRLEWAVLWKLFVCSSHALFCEFCFSWYVLMKFRENRIRTTPHINVITGKWHWVFIALKHLKHTILDSLITSWTMKMVDFEVVQTGNIEQCSNIYSLPSFIFSVMVRCERLPCDITHIFNKCHYKILNYL